MSDIEVPYRTPAFCLLPRVAQQPALMPRVPSWAVKKAAPAPQAVALPRTPASSGSPLLDAFAAAERCDVPGVRSALEGWVREAHDPDDKKERMAQLHYWLYRAGDTDQLANLSEMERANPHLTEIATYCRLARQERGELWS